MIKISNIKLNIDHTKNDILDSIYKVLKTNKINSFTIDKKSLDARKKSNIHYIYSVIVNIDNEEKYLKFKNVSKAKIPRFKIEKRNLNTRPIVIGSGPAGLFSALILTLANTRPIVIERGCDVESRKNDIEDFWNNSKLKLNSNVQFGEGGAGTFSDGKLTTGIKDLRCKFILEKLVEFGAPKEILYLSKPHIGTDILIKVVKNMREYLIENGATFLFEHQLNDIIVSDGKLAGIVVNSKEIECENLILAIGHSARDSFEMIYKRGVKIMQKPFAMGVRIEHLQDSINKSQYGDTVINSAEYKLACNATNRGVYTFCMCPGGLVVASSSEENTVVTNGMSYYNRDLENANSALLVNISTDDFGGAHPLQGMYLQRELEKACFEAGGSNYYAPAQLVKDFLNNVCTKEFKSVKPSYLPGVKGANLNDILPKFMCDSLKEGIIKLDKKLSGFAYDEAVLTAIESRTSSPIKIYRDESYMSNISGIYPCGEGAGYAGGIMSAAVDGIRCAEAILNINVVM